MPLKMRGYDARALSEETGTDTGSDTIVQQHYADEVDINTIVRRFGVTGSMPFGPNGPAIYGDFSGISDWESALATIERAEESFMALPAEVRAKFDNDPGKLVEYSQSVSEEEFLTTFAARTEPGVSPPVV